MCDAARDVGNGLRAAIRRVRQRRGEQSFGARRRQLAARRAPRLAVLVRGNLSTRGLQYRAATLGWLKLQNSNSQRLVTHKKPSYRQARERRGDRKLQ